MRLYSGTKSFIEDSTYNRIAAKLKDAFFLEVRYQPAVAEVNQEQPASSRERSARSFRFGFSAWSGEHPIDFRVFLRRGRADRCRA